MKYSTDKLWNKIGMTAVEILAAGTKQTFFENRILF